MSELDRCNEHAASRPRYRCSYPAKHEGSTHWCPGWLWETGQPAEPDRCWLGIPEIEALKQRIAAAVNVATLMRDAAAKHGRQATADAFSALIRMLTEGDTPPTEPAG